MSWLGLVLLLLFIYGYTCSTIVVVVFEVACIILCACMVDGVEVIVNQDDAFLDFIEAFGDVTSEVFELVKERKHDQRKGE